jgi:hypothetical protein
MGFRINDKDIDERLDRLVKQIKNDFGIRNVSKVDAIRYLLKINKQGKKTSRKWGDLF